MQLGLRTLEDACLLGIKPLPNAIDGGKSAKDEGESGGESEDLLLGQGLLGVR